MGKTSKWLRSILTGKKAKEKEKENCLSDHNSIAENPTTPISIPQSTPKEKRRWSFRRSSASAAPSKDSNSAEHMAVTPPPVVQAAFDAENEHKKHAMAVVVATAAAADAAVAAAQAAAAVIRLTAAANGKASAIEEAAAIKIQSVFRSHLVGDSTIQNQFQKIMSKMSKMSRKLIRQLFCWWRIAGKKSIVCIERIGEVAGTGERSSCEEASHGYPPVYAGIGDGAGASSCSEDPGG